MPLLPWHTKRFNRTRQLQLGITSEIDLSILHELADPPATGLFKCRIVYSHDIQLIEFVPYHIRKIHSLRLVEDDTIDYFFKSTDREHLKQLFAQRSMDDDILIVKNGFLTDTYYSNVVLENEEGLFTPETYLLHGVRRMQLLATKQIQTATIRPEDLPRFQRIHLINAMMDLGDCVLNVADVYKR